jgi:hypothetical protein
MLLVRQSDGSTQLSGNAELPSIQLTPSTSGEGARPRFEASLESQTQAPVTFVSRTPKRWLGGVGQTIRNGFRHASAPVAACLVASTLLLSGCAHHGGRIHTGGVPAIQTQQQAKVDLDLTRRIVAAHGDAGQLATLLQGVPHARAIASMVSNLDHPAQTLAILDAKMADPKARADLASLDGVHQVIRLLEMEAHTKNGATPIIGVFIDGAVATQTEYGGRWDEDKNRAWTVRSLGPNGSIDLLLLCPVSGHAKDHYPDALYQQYTSHRTAPANDYERMRANAQIYSNNNSQYVYLTDDPSSYQMGKIVVADVKANGRHVTPVRVRLEGLEPGKTYEVRWSPFVGADPNNPTVHFAGFRNGRSFRLIIPANVQVAQR